MLEAILILLILMAIIYFGGQIDLTFLEAQSKLEIEAEQKRKNLNASKLIDEKNT